jgi:hypothetical protein
MQQTAIQPLLAEKIIPIPKSKVYCEICAYTADVGDADEFVHATLSHFAQRPGHVLVLKR